MYSTNTLNFISCLCKVVVTVMAFESVGPEIESEQKTFFYLAMIFMGIVFNSYTTGALFCFFKIHAKSAHDFHWF